MAGICRFGRYGLIRSKCFDHFFGFRPRAGDTTLPIFRRSHQGATVMSMNRIDTKFAQLRAEKRAGFIAYICGGDPSLDATCELVCAFDRAGVDLMEIGVPFSDPLADGI